jgi:hypothetical protein
LFDQEYPGGDWLQLCTEPDLAPFGDILWRSELLPLEAILESVNSAYKRFYNDARLGRVVARLPEPERAAITNAYDHLRSERARSWDAARSDRRGLVA